MSPGRVRGHDRRTDESRGIGGGKPPDFNRRRDDDCPINRRSRSRSRSRDRLPEHRGCRDVKRNHRFTPPQALSSDRFTSPPFVGDRQNRPSSRFEDNRANSCPNELREKTRLPSDNPAPSLEAGLSAEQKHARGYSIGAAPLCSKRGYDVWSNARLSEVPLLTLNTLPIATESCSRSLHQLDSLWKDHFLLDNLNIPQLRAVLVMLQHTTNNRIGVIAALIPLLLIVTVGRSELLTYTYMFRGWVLPRLPHTPYDNLSWKDGVSSGLLYFKGCDWKLNLLLSLPACCSCCQKNLSHNARTTTISFTCVFLMEIARLMAISTAGKSCLVLVFRVWYLLNHLRRKVSGEKMGSKLGK